MTIKQLLGAGAAILLTLSVGGAVLAAPVDMRSGKQIEVKGQFSEMVFAAGDDVAISATSTDTVFASGGKVSVRDAQLSDLIMAGGEMNIAASKAHDVIAAGGQIDLTSGEIADDLVAAGGQIRLHPEAKLTGSAVIAGGELTIETPIGGDLFASGGRIRIDAPVTGNVTVNGGSVTLGPNAKVGGDLKYRAGTFSRAAEASVAGKTTVLPAPKRPDRGVIAAAAAGFGVLMMLGVVLLGIALALAAPRLMSGVATSVSERPLSALGIGLLTAIGFPVIIVILLAMVVGVPIAMALAAAFALLCLIAGVSGAYGLAMALRQRVRKDAPPAASAGARALWAAIGVIVLCVICLVPILGQIVGLIVFLLGLGALAINASRALSAANAAASAAA